MVARVASLPEADRNEFQVLLEALEQEWKPADTREDLLVWDIATGTLTKRRALQIESEYFASCTQDDDVEDEPATLAVQFARVSAMLEKLWRYATTADNRVARATAQLVALQLARAKRSEPEAESRGRLPEGDNGVTEVAVAETAAPASEKSRLFAEAEGGRDLTRVAGPGDIVAVADWAFCETKPVAPLG